MRHLDVNALWIQEQQVRESIEMLKIKGSLHSADICTKGLNDASTVRCLDTIGLKVRVGRARDAVEVHVLKKRPKAVNNRISQHT